MITPVNPIYSNNDLYPKAVARQLNRFALLNRTRRVMLIVACLLSPFVIPAWAAADGNIHVGQLRIHPFVTVSDTISDNVFYTPDDEKRDSIITYTPGIKLELPFGRHRAEVQYYSVISRYRTYTGEDTSDENAEAMVDFNLAGGFGLGLSDTYTKGHLPRSSSATGLIEKFKHNVGVVSTTYSGDRAKLQFDASKGRWDYQTSPFQDRDETTFSGYLFYRFLPKMSAFIECDREKIAYDDRSQGLDNNAYTEWFGLRWEITEKSKGTIKAGYQQKDFESPSQGSFRGWVSSADLHHDFSQYTGLTIKGERAVNEASIQGTRYVVSTGVYAELSHTLTRKVDILGRGSYGTDDFSNPVPPDTITREDKISLEGLGLKYSMRNWLTFEFDYNSRTRRSNLPVFDYKENSYIISVKMAL